MGLQLPRYMCTLAGKRKKNKKFTGFDHVRIFLIFFSILIATSSLSICSSIIRPRRTVIRTNTNLSSICVCNFDARQTLWRASKKKFYCHSTSQVRTTIFTQNTFSTDMKFTTSSSFLSINLTKNMQTSYLWFKERLT